MPSDLSQYHDDNVILVVLKVEYSGRSRSLAWLSMPGILASPGHKAAMIVTWFYLSSTTTACIARVILMSR